MMDGFKRSLKAYLGHDWVASLVLTDDDTLRFIYQPVWQEKGYALSPHLPLDNSAQADEFRIRVFFQNLFPEGENLDIFLKNWRISRNNTFAITQALGHDLPGALQCLPDDVPLSKRGLFIPIQSSEIIERLKHYDPANLIIWDGKPRLSLAGVHQKINIMINQAGAFGFAEGTLASTHILKFERDSLKHLVMNEYLMMTLAKKIGMDVAEVELKYFDTFPTLLVKRFDRKLKDSLVYRRHMIDGCQALNLLPEYKYERNLGSTRDVKDIREGATLKLLFEFCGHCQNPALDKKKLLEWILFNLIIGNHDAHAKNLSFFVSGAGIELAPAYDLLSVQMYPEFSQELSMALGDEFQAEYINAYQLADFAETCQIPRATLAQSLIKMCKDISENLQQLPAEGEFGKKLMHQINQKLEHFEKQTSLITTIDL